MPNWVITNITVGGSSQTLEEFWKHISVRPRLCEDDDTFSFSFHSFVTDDNLDPQVYHGTHGSGPDGPLGDTEDNWYNWNNKHWNTKWDACDAYISREEYDTGNGTKELKALRLEFNTAWSPAGPVFQAMSEQWPNLNFRVWWEEEQGFGEEFLLHSGGTVQMIDTWDIPDSHKDYENRGNEEGCICAWDSDKDNWYTDCPGKATKVYTIEVVTKYTIVAENDDAAKAAAEASESGYDLPERTTVRGVEYAEEYRIAGFVEEEDDE